MAKVMYDGLFKNCSCSYCTVGPKEIDKTGISLILDFVVAYKLELVARTRPYSNTTIKLIHLMFSIIDVGNRFKEMVALLKVTTILKDHRDLYRPHPDTEVGIFIEEVLEHCDEYLYLNA